MTALPKLNMTGPIVVVDDDEAYRLQVKDMLEKKGYQVVLQDSGSHALRYLQNQPWNWFPALVITDIVMDGMGGFQLIRRIQELYTKKDVPVIVISRLDAGVDVGEAEVAGAAAYLTKPIEEERLFETLERVLNREKGGMLIFTSDYGRRKKRVRKSGR